MNTARALILVPLFILLEVVAYDLPPMTWYVWELEHPDICCATLWQIVFIGWGIPALCVLVTHVAVALVLNELVRLVVVGTCALGRLLRTRTTA